MNQSSSGTPSVQPASHTATAAPTLPPLFRLAPELKEMIFKLLFDNRYPHEVSSVGTVSQRSGQLLRVCKLMHQEAGEALYGMTQFEFSGMALRHPEYLPMIRYRSLIKHLTLEDPEYMSLHLDEYPSLRNLTFSVPRFLQLQQGAQAMSRARRSHAMNAVVHWAQNMPELEVAIEGEVYEFRNGWYFTVRRRVLLKEAEVRDEVSVARAEFVVPVGSQGPMPIGSGVMVAFGRMYNI